MTSLTMTFLRATRALVVLFAALPGLLHASSQQGLLPVEQAFRLSWQAQPDGELRLSWDIASGYYLYKERIKVRALDDGVTPGDLVLPDGVAKHDEYFGDVQIYRDWVEARLALAGATRIAITVQGCHEVDPQICYPPYVTNLNVAAGGGADPNVSASDAAAIGEPVQQGLQRVASASSSAMGIAGVMALAILITLGLALPFLAIGFIPALASRLPRPDAWIETLKQFLAFPLYATAAWLAWVLTRQRGAAQIVAELEGERS